MKKLGFSFIFSIYFVQAVAIYAFVSSNSDILSNLVFIVLFFAGVSTIIGISNVVVVIKNFSRYKDNLNKQKSLNNMSICLKLLLIPFWVINFLIWFMVSTALFVIPGLFILLPIVLIGATLFAFTILLTTSAYSLCSIYIQFRNKRLSFRQFILGVVFQFLFILDVISYIYWYFKIKKLINEQSVHIDI